MCCAMKLEIYDMSKEKPERCGDRENYGTNERPPCLYVCAGQAGLCGYLPTGSPLRRPRRTEARPEQDGVGKKPLGAAEVGAEIRLSRKENHLSHTH